MLSVVTPGSSRKGTAAKSSNSHCVQKAGANGALDRGREFSLTVLPEPAEDMTSLIKRVAGALDGATILSLLVFGSANAAVAVAKAMRQVFGKLDWPMTWVEGNACDNRPIAGIQISAFGGRSVQRIQLDGHVAGSVYEEGGARHCVLGGLGPVKNSLSPKDQTRQTLERAQAALAQAGFTFGDTVRTWFFLKDILAWYDDFNAARTEIYSGTKFRTGSLPASTGVGARNPAGAALVIAARAMQPLDTQTRALETASPLQCPAPAYGSSFSRAMELSTGNMRQLFISGTASIAPGGKTVWQNDVQKQVELAMKVVEAILHSRGFSFADLTRAVAYFKHRADASAFSRWCNAAGLSSLPVVVAHCDICRDDLLFELEADARRTISSAG
jgi:enamine deaminase RidA (YjgF/YER057c/UK114 family)